MLLIYTEDISPRFTYITEHIFKRMLGVDFEITTDLEKFIMASDSKISYAKARIGDEFFIKNFGLLFEKGINITEIYINYWDQTPYFFCSKKGDFPFDILSAAFYLISRYEEYLPFIKSKEGTFPATESLAFKYHFLHLPIIDIWVKYLREKLSERYPSLSFSTSSYRPISVIEIRQAYAYLHKGIFRNGWQLLQNLLRIDIQSITEQILTMLRLKKDPFCIFEELIAFQKGNQVQSIFFFLLSDYNYHDRNISYYNNDFQELIRMVADLRIVSLLGAYQSSKNATLLKKERHRMIHIIKRPVKRVCINQNHIFLPQTYQALSESEFNEDYSMGYASHPGFRAGTCTPFFFYDLTAETQLPIWVNPFCFHSDALETDTPKREIARKILALRNSVQSVNGQFLTVFTNDKLAHRPQNEHWRSIYRNLFKK